MLISSAYAKKLSGRYRKSPETVYVPHVCPFRRAPGAAQITVNPALGQVALRFERDRFEPDRWVRDLEMRRLGTPDDIVHAVLFFASDFAGWVTGETLGVDGGK